MAAARENGEHMSEDLHAEQRLLRQTAISEEIVGLASGLRALKRRQSQES